MRFFAFFLSLLVASFASFAYADESKHADIHVAFVDRDVISTDALVFKNIREQVDARKIQLQNEFSQKEEDLHKAESELTKQRTILSEEAFDRKAKDFSKMVGDVQQEVSSKKADLEEVYVRAVEEVYGKVKSITSGIAKELGVDLVFFVLKKNQVLYSVPDIDISDKVLKVLDKEMSSFTMKFL